MKNRKLLIFILLSASITLSACNRNPNSPGTDMSPVAIEPAGAPVNEETYEPGHESIDVMNPYAVSENEVLITAVGDIMVHKSQWLSQATGEDSYDFRNNFEHVRDFFIHSDLAIANLETTINDDKPVASYPRFNSPDELLDGLKYAGFNLIGTANNHSMDTGFDGILNTLNELEERGLDATGTHADPNEKKYLIKNVKNINIGIAAFSTAYFNANGVVINNIESGGMEKHVNYMELTDPVRAFERLKVQIDAMKNDNAEFIVLILHWGNEYEKKANRYQRTLAQMLIDEGVDLILGSHPHMVQEMEFMNSTDGMHEGLVVYSMGNFLSNQRNEILNMTGTEDGLISRIVLMRDSSEKVIIKEAQFVPTWINRSEHGELFVYEIIPIGIDPAAAAESFQADESSLAESLQNTLNVISDPKVQHFSINE